MSARPADPSRSHASTTRAAIESSASRTFGNVHGAYKPGVVKLRPGLLHEIQQGVWNGVQSGTVHAVLDADVPEGKPFELVFHGGSGSTAQEIAEAVRQGYPTPCPFG